MAAVSFCVPDANLPRSQSVMVVALAAGSELKCFYLQMRVTLAWIALATVVLYTLWLDTLFRTQHAVRMEMLSGSFDSPAARPRRPHKRCPDTCA